MVLSPEGRMLALVSNSDGYRAVARNGQASLA